ncbi:MAG: hypothetical protein ABWY64_21475 [Tardiphaga sp.]
MTNVTAMTTTETTTEFDDLSAIVALLSDPDETVNLDGAKKLAMKLDLALGVEFEGGRWFAAFKSRTGNAFLSDQHANTLHGALWTACHLALDEVIERGKAAMK